MEFWSEYPEIQEILYEVEEYMKQSIVSRKPLLTEISLDLVEAGGKRLRPTFTILAAQQGKAYQPDTIIPIAGAIELLHTATLVHDDIIDEAKFRRGKQSVYSKWGKDMAIYTGDYLFSRAFMMLSKKTSFNQLYYLAHGIKAICEGEVDQHESLYNIDIKVYDYLKRIYRKTAVLFAISTTIGAHESKAPKKVIKALGEIGIAYGIAFQIKDDLLDYTTTEEIIGKPIGNDIQQGVYTLPLLYAIQEPKVGEKIKTILQQKEIITKGDIATVIQLVNQTKGIAKAESLGRRYIERGKRNLVYLPNTKSKKVFSDLFDQLLN
ncbi:MAG: polyprenyl synthetase family protein [Epulopiscium sp.]|nr:polyprenyl synthetase family protein [Candidatus Epulonipiscium sp.]